MSLLRVSGESRCVTLQEVYVGVYDAQISYTALKADIYDEISASHDEYKHGRQSQRRFFDWSFIRLTWGDRFDMTYLDSFQQLVTRHGKTLY